jgi:hypothetical protein
MAMIGRAAGANCRAIRGLVGGAIRRICVSSAGVDPVAERQLAPPTQGAYPGKGDKDRSTLLAEIGRDELRAHLRKSEAQHEADRRAGLAGVWMPDALDRKYPNPGRELAWFWVSPSRTLSTDPRAGSCVGIT